MISWVVMSILALNSGNVFRAAARTFRRNGVTVSLRLGLENFLRNCSKLVMSALSNCVTWGIVVQQSVMCSAVFLRMLFIGWRSIAPHLLKSGNGLVATPPGAIVVREVLSALAKSLTSSMEILPPGPVPGTWATLIPIS